MQEYTERTYRRGLKTKGLVSFNVMVKETDLWISAEKNLYKEALDRVIDYRLQLENYIKDHKNFLTTLIPLQSDSYASPIIKTMIDSTQKIGVGPMASVAGAVSQFVANDLLKITDQVIVENGGDIFMKTNNSVIVSIFAGKSSLSERVGLKILTKQMPLGICSSSGTIGHSLSLGSADVVCLLSDSAVLADGAATALCNRIKNKKDLEKISDWASQINGIKGGVAILDDAMATWGEVELVGL